MQLGEAGPARQHFERTLALLGSPMPASTLGWLDVLASQALQRRLRRLRPGALVERQQEQRTQAAERAATCRHMAEACWVLENWPALLPLALFGLNQAERAGRLDLTASSQVWVGTMAGTAGLRRLGHRQVQAAVEATDRAGDPITICWTQLLGGLHWLGVGDWTTLDARAPTALAAGAAASLHRLADEVVLIGAVCRYLTGRFSEAAAMAADARAAGRDRHDPVVHLWGLLILLESRLRVDAGDPATAEWLEEADQLVTQQVGRIDTVRAHLAAAQFHLAGGRAATAWRATRTAAELAGREPFYAPYTLEGHAGIPEVCLALLERGEPTGVDPAELRATAAIGLRRLPLRPLHTDGPVPDPCLPRLVALAPGPPRRRLSSLDAGHREGRAARHALGAGPRPPPAWPPPGRWSALPARHGPDRAPRPGPLDLRGARLPHRAARPNRDRRLADLNLFRAGRAAAGCPSSPLE